MKLYLPLIMLCLFTKISFCSSSTESVTTELRAVHLEKSAQAALLTLSPYTPYKTLAIKIHFERMLIDFPLFVSNVLALVASAKNPAAVASHALQIVNTVVTMMQESMSKEEIINEASQESAEKTRLPLHPAHEESATHHAAQKQAKKEEIINTVLCMLGNFAHILADPHNPDIVRPHTAGMITGLLNIISIAKKNRLFEEDPHLDEALDYLLHDADVQALQHQYTLL